MPSLEALLASGSDVSAVVTNPDKPAGRGLERQAPAVKAAALDAGLEVLQPHRARDPELQETLRSLRPDICVVVAYGQILPVSLLEIPSLGFVNVHFSLLPAYRGAAPVQRAVIDGADRTGVSIMVLTEGMDEGPVLAQRACDIGPDETAGQLGDLLARIGADLLADTLPRYEAGALAPQPQDDARATYAPKLTDEEARIDWDRPGRAIKDLVRGTNPHPGAWTTLRGKRLKVYRARIGDEPDRLRPGELRASGDLVVGTADLPLVLEEVQPAGKRRMAGDELARGLRVEEEESVG